VAISTLYERYVTQDMTQALRTKPGIRATRQAD
jgi:hypothetical protein